MIFVFKTATETPGENRKVEWSDVRFHIETCCETIHTYTRISCFIMYLCVCFPSQHQQYSLTIMRSFDALARILFKMHYDLEMSQADLQRQ